MIDDFGRDVADLLAHGGTMIRSVFDTPHFQLTTRAKCNRPAGADLPTFANLQQAQSVYLRRILCGCKVPAATSGVAINLSEQFNLTDLEPTLAGLTRQVARARRSPL